MISWKVPGVLVCLTLAGSLMMMCSQRALGDGREMKTAKGTPMKGQWGGQGVSMEATDSGATFTFDCARGSIGEPMVSDHNGKFLLKGFLTTERPGPTHKDDAAAGQPATYSGLVEGQTLTLTITLTADKETMGPFTLTLGKAGRLRRCM